MEDDQQNQKCYRHDGYDHALFQNDFRFSLDEVEMYQQQDRLCQAQNDRRWKGSCFT
jgi:hypothetical protein